MHLYAAGLHGLPKEDTAGTGTCLVAWEAKVTALVPLPLAPKLLLD